MSKPVVCIKFQTDQCRRENCSFLHKKTCPKFFRHQYCDIFNCPWLHIPARYDMPREHVADKRAPRGADHMRHRERGPHDHYHRNPRGRSPQKPNSRGRSPQRRSSRGRSPPRHLLRRRSRSRSPYMVDSASKMRYASGYSENSENVRFSGNPRNSESFAPEGYSPSRPNCFSPVYPQTTPPPSPTVLRSPTYVPPDININRVEDLLAMLENKNAANSENTADPIEPTEPADM